MRPIDADKLKETLSGYKASGGHKYYKQGMDDTLHYFMPKIIDDEPTIDAVLVKHGKWEYERPTINTYGRVKCTHCKWWTLDPSVSAVYHFCPNCGAKMDLEE